jgi:tripartite-type tricarboxylate transporter receptor subunit TctC
MSTPVATDRRRRRLLLRTAAASLLAVTGGVRARGPYPERPITLWVPWAAGGSTDRSMRVLAALAAAHLKQKVVVENRPGAGGTMAMPLLHQAEPDGYHIAQIPQPVLRVPFTRKVAWDPIRDVTPIIRVSGVAFGVLVARSSPVRTLDGLFEHARQHPAALTIATNGVATTPHLVLEELFTARGLTYVHVPYKGVAEQLIALESGQVMAGVGASGFASAVDAGRLRLLAICCARRSPRWPAVPTLKELGFPIVATSPWGLGGPQGLPPDIVGRLHDAFRLAMHAHAFVDELARYDQQPDYLGPAAYGAWLREQVARERAAVERLGVLVQGA